MSILAGFVWNEFIEDNYQSTIVYDDPHRNNLLFSGERVYIIDCDSFIEAPDIYQVATIICCAFLIEGYEISDIERLAQYWRREYELTDIMRYIYIRALLGYAYFWNCEEDLANEIKSKYLKVMCNVKEKC